MSRYRKDFYGKYYCLAFEDFLKHRKPKGDLKTCIKKFIKRYPSVRDFDDIILGYMEEKNKMSKLPSVLGTNSDIHLVASHFNVEIEIGKVDCPNLVDVRINKSNSDDIDGFIEYVNASRPFNVFVRFDIV